MTRVPKPADRDVTETVSVTDSTSIWLNSSGPFETREQARAAVAHVYDAAWRSARRGVLTEGSHRLLCSALTAAGVEAGGYDHEVIAWLSTWGPETCAVVAGLVTRAAGQEAAP